MNFPKAGARWSPRSPPLWERSPGDQSGRDTLAVGTVVTGVHVSSVMLTVSFEKTNTVQT